ncbi:MAG TPA: ElyC/SanA/YdcF family protein [Candidatus Dojkabacteria bacterium]|nr:ElyC/SanA/YdcF family protein [Candidatus Dojkabacteria bacterium]HQF36126.1 ElyC/SanA/YdcF family protein [Candidatus Dojkabacteria bacterium]
MKFKHNFYKIFVIVCITSVVVLFVTMVIFERIVAKKYSDRIYSNSDVSEEIVSKYFGNDDENVVLILGAGIINNEEPSIVLADRISVGADLYFSGAVDKFLMSGDNRFKDYNEPEVMRNYAVELGVDDDDIIIDNAGRRTYDSCYRAKYIFGIDNLVIVTQDFHLPRALYICNELGINSIGFTSNLNEYAGYNNYLLRERGARVLAFIDVLRKKPSEVMEEE